MRRGSITIFSLLSMILVASALFAMLEASRFQGITRLAELQTQVALESVFAGYNTYLWEEYRILACKQSNVNDGIQKNIEGRKIEEGWGTNFYQFRVDEITQMAYTRLTDGDGCAFIQAATGYMEKNLLYETAKTIYNQYEGIKYIKNNSDFDFYSIEKALKRMREENNSEGNSKSKNEEIVAEVNANPYKGVENPLEIIQSLQEKGILSLVLDDSNQLSKKEFDLSNTVSRRELPEEFHPSLEESNWYTRVLFQQYLLTYLSNYRNEKEHSLDYEMEYVLGGKATEVGNLKVVVNQLLALREAANFLYLSSNPVMVEQARLLAVTLTGVSLNPVIINVVKTAVLAAWAFAESVLDIRTLLTGGKIALLKSDRTWTMDLDYISTIGKGYAKAKNCTDGLCYEDYLGILLLFQQDNQLAKRTMDVQELTLRQQYENENICMEDWIVDVDVKVIYQYNPVFFSIHQMLPFWKYKIATQKKFEY